MKFKFVTIKTRTTKYGKNKFVEVKAVKIIDGDREQKVLTISKGNISKNKRFYDNDKSVTIPVAHNITGKFYEDIKLCLDAFSV